MKPRILFVVDTDQWAWGIKTREVRKHLSDEFEIDMLATIEKRLEASSPKTTKVDLSSYDLCFTYGYSFIDFLKSVPKHKKITGVTAHRPTNIIAPKMAKATAIHANSSLLYKQVSKLHPNVYYLPNGVNENLFKFSPIPENREFTAGHVGKLSPRKGQKEIIEPAIKEAGVKYVYHYNKFRDKKPHNKMPKIYYKFDVALIASIEDGTPGSLLEAASCGRPAISNKIGNAPEFIKDGINGFLVGRNINEYVEKLLWLQKNRKSLIKMGEEARKTVESGWTWKIQSENYRKMFKELLNGKKI